MNVLVINSGSSSLKYKLFDMPDERVLISGRIENIGETGKPARIIQSAYDQSNQSRSVDCPNHEEAIKQVMSVLTCPDPASGKNPDIDAVGHRVVHGGNRFSAPEVITTEVIESLKELTELAPLHMPLNLMCIEACAEILPHAESVACFDTAFSHDMPEYTRLYPVPIDWYTRHDIRRYGFHGISYEYVTASAAEMLGKPLGSLKLIATHLGNGSSITAFDRGRVLDTSMGFTPIEGLMMGTRSGNFDPAIFPHIMARTGMSVDEVLDLLNRKSGLLGISGISRDMRVLLKAGKQGIKRAELAIDMFVHILRKYIGAYFFALAGSHAIVFTGGIGENAPEIRQAVFENLSFLGLTVDPEKNNSLIDGQAGVISTSDSSSKILVIPTDEERMIARSVHENLSTSAQSVGIQTPA